MTPIPESDVGELLQQRLRADTDVKHLVGDRIRPDALEQGDALPAIKYETVACDSQMNLNGPAGFAFSRVQFDCYGRTRREANLVAKAVINCLHGFTGFLAADCRVSDCTLDNKYDRKDPPAEGDGKFRPRRVLDFQISHTEPIPTLS